jgi:peptidoglycan hydrolase-like protein with peptidoglycan-binding domain
MKSSQEKLIEGLQAQIAALKAQIAQLQAKIAKILRKKISCQKFENNLYYGMRSKEVRCLQEFLKSQGLKIYPEGLVTGFFGPLTRAAVIRFQERYAKDILYPLGLKKGTGFVGPATRSKINQFLNK